MPSNKCCTRTANDEQCPLMPNRKRTNLTDPDRPHQNFLWPQQILSIWQKFPSSVCTRTRPNWNNLANQHRERPITLRVQRVHRNFAKPKKWIWINTSHAFWNVYIRTKVSASRKTHFSNCVKRQQCNLVKVIPSSGRANNAKFAASFESNTLTTWTTSKTVCNLACIASVTPGVIMTHSLWAVFTFFSELATTRAPNEYESFVANVTHANSAKKHNIKILTIISFLCVLCVQRKSRHTNWAQFSNAARNKINFVNKI